MIFNSLEFILFILIVFFCYWFVFNNNLKIQNLFILFSSYMFYGWWDWRFLILIFFSTILDYFIGLKIYHGKSNNRKFYLILSIFFNLSLLGFFKYFNFFIDSWVSLISLIGFFEINRYTLNIILPIGISFYTFQTMSYSIDIYYRRIKPTRDFISFASFVCFFPQLVAGPIERASNFLPQILEKRVFEYQKSVQALRLILWGMFKKVVIADSLSIKVDYCFNNYQSLDGGSLLIGLIYFSIQIYCDFSGYSDIAIGIAKLFGFELMSNFNFPYFSRNISEFWRRWHISLSSWFRDYVYIPLGGSKVNKCRTIRNILIVFTISGFWHGANLTFILWGICHFILYVPSYLFSTNRKYLSLIVAENKKFPSFIEIVQIFITFFLISITWVFFRADTIIQSFNYLVQMINKISFPKDNRSGLVFVVLFLIFDWSNRRDERNPFNYKNKYFRYLIYLIISYLVFAHFRLVDLKHFIYFQF